MKRIMVGAIVFAAMIAILIGVLQLMNWIPSVIQEGALQQYASWEEVKAKLKITPLYTPVYYPKNVRWPPSLIAAQTRPYTAVVTEFKAADSEETMLVVSQTKSPNPPLRETIHIAEIRENVPFSLKNRAAVLETGSCNGGEQCSRISWTEGGYAISVSMHSSPVELFRIAESIIPGKEQQSDR